MERQELQNKKLEELTAFYKGEGKRCACKSKKDLQTLHQALFYNVLN